MRMRACACAYPHACVPARMRACTRARVSLSNLPTRESPFSITEPPPTLEPPAKPTLRLDPSLSLSNFLYKPVY